MNLKEVLEMMSGTRINREIRGVSIDTRTLKSGEVFFAFRGEKQDGHRFVDTAFRKGAVAAVVNKEFDLKEKKREKVLIKVKDPLSFLVKFAALYRKKHNARVIAITGSCGKTSTKSMVSRVLEERGRVYPAPKSYNNRIGVALTLLNAPQDAEYIVAELGTNNKGEIKELTLMSKPDTGLITGVGPSHLEGLDTVASVLEEKLFLFKKMNKRGKRFYNYDDPLLRKSVKREFPQSKGFGFSRGGDLRCIDFKVRKGGIECTFSYGDKKTKVNLQGFYHKGSIYSALAAFSIAREENLPEQSICRAIRSISPPDGRGVLKEIKENILVYDDSYNANPVSFLNSLNAFRDISRLWKVDLKIGVLGQMLELGKRSNFYHLKILNEIEKIGFNRVFLIGEEWERALKKKNIEYIHMALCESAEEAGKKLSEELKKLRNSRVAVLLKGSRRVGVEKTLKFLKGV